MKGVHGCTFPWLLKMITVVYLNRYIKGFIRERRISDWVVLSYICIFHS